MRLFFLFVLITFCLSCDRECSEIAKYHFSEEQEQYVPYQLNQSVSFIDSMGNLIVGNVVSKSIESETKEVNNSCDYISTQTIFTTIKINNNEQFNIILFNNDTPITFYLGHLKNNDEKVFVAYEVNGVSNISFGSVSLAGETFNNAILLTKRNEEDTVTDQLVYSKTNGIEFILFEDGTWYKRVE